jgi:hypothetical protein
MSGAKTGTVLLNQPGRHKKPYWDTQEFIRILAEMAWNG